MYWGMMQKRRPTVERGDSARVGQAAVGQAAVVALPRCAPLTTEGPGGDVRTVGQAAERPEGDDDVAEEEEEGERTLAVVLGLLEEAQAAAERRAQLLVAQLAHAGQPAPHVAQGSGCGQGEDNGDGDRGLGG